MSPSQEVEGVDRGSSARGEAARAGGASSGSRERSRPLAEAPGGRPVEVAPGGQGPRSSAGPGDGPAAGLAHDDRGRAAASASVDGVSSAEAGAGGVSTGREATGDVPSGGLVRGLLGAGARVAARTARPLLGAWEGAAARAPKTPVRRVVALCCGWTGDTFWAGQVLAALAARWPEAELHVAVRGRGRDVLPALPPGRVHLLAHVPSDRTREPVSWRGLLQDARALAGLRPDVVVDLTGNRYSALVTALARPRWSLGPGDHELAALYARAAASPASGEHLARAPWRLVEALAAAGDGEGPAGARWEAPAPPALLRDPAAVRVELGLSPAASVAVLAPGAGWTGKRWPADRFAALARRLARAGFSVVVAGAPSERALLEAVAGAASGERGPPGAGSARAHGCAGPVTGAPPAGGPAAGSAGGAASGAEARVGPGEASVGARAGRAPLDARREGAASPAARVLAHARLDRSVALVAGAALFVGNDSGLTHVAAAFGVPTVALFGPTNPARYGPLGPRVTVLRHACPDRPEGALAHCHGRPAWPCAPSCWDALDVDAVEAACLRAADAPARAEASAVAPSARGRGARGRPLPRA